MPRDFTTNATGGEAAELSEFITVKSARVFARAGEWLSFIDLQARARMRAEAAIGYIAGGETVWPFLEKDGQSQPLRLRKREWSEDDRVVVVETN